MPASREPEESPYVDEDHEAIATFADRYLDDDERETFVEHLLERHGYQRISGWGPRGDDGGAPDSEPEPEPARPGRTRAPASPPARQGKRPPYFKR